MEIGKLKFAGNGWLATPEVIGELYSDGSHKRWNRIFWRFYWQVKG
jgi:hypothetical protein